MIKNILWDFDGVIHDSMKIKGNGFLELFKEFDTQKLKALEAFHYANGGTSRFDKIKFFYAEILNETISEKKVLELAGKFAHIIEDKIRQPEFLIEESNEFIKRFYTEYNFHIVSGAEHNELNQLCVQFDISKYFISINGSPTKKEDLVAEVCRKYHYNQEETILIGDSINDHDAALKNSIRFYGYNNQSLKKVSDVYIDCFKNFQL